MTAIAHALICNKVKSVSRESFAQRKNAILLIHFKLNGPMFKQTSVKFNNSYITNDT